VHLSVEVACHEYFSGIVAAGSKKLFMDFYINLARIFDSSHKIFNYG